MTMASWPLAASIVVTLVLVAWAVLPCLLAALHWGGYRVGATGGPSDCDPDGNGLSYADRYQALLALQFEPVGKVWEEVLGQRTTLFVLVQRAENCRACFYRYGSEWRLFLATAMNDGAAVVTAHYARERTESTALLACGLPGCALTELLELHREQVERFRAVGIVPTLVHELEDVVTVTRALHFNPSVRRRHTRLLMAYFLIRLGVFGGVPALVGTTAGSIGYSLDTSWTAALVAAVVVVAVPRLVGLLISGPSSTPYRLAQRSGKKGEAFYSKRAGGIGAAQHGG